VGDTEYIFKHALTQEVAYNSVLIERRKQLHERIGAALEELYASSIEDHLDELAHHYSKSGNPAKALEYHERAGRQAVQRSAFGEAMQNLPPPGNFFSACRKMPNETDENLPFKPASSRY
jgi:predicted ATPase